MKIAICDDEQVIGTQLRALVSDYFTRAGMEHRIDVFTTADALLAATTVYDLLFLDCQLGDITGIELGRRLRERLPSAEIIFISAYEQFLFESYEVRNFRYLLKPLDAEKINRTLDDYMLSWHDRKPVFVMTDLSLPAEDLVYIEVIGNYTSAVTMDSSYRSRKSLADYERELDPGTFFRINKSVIIHLGKIESHCDNKVTLIQGSVFRVSRRVKTQFIRSYVRYINLHR